MGDASVSGGAPAVARRAARRIVRAARAWLAEHPAARRRRVRFDVVAIAGDGAERRVEIVKDAF